VIAGGVYASWKGLINLPSINFPGAPATEAAPLAPGGVTPTTPAPPTLAPLPGIATATPLPPLPPAQPVTRIIVEPYQPQESDPYPTLQNLVMDWEGSATPGTQTWEITMPANLPALLFLGWCASTPAVLNENFGHLMYLAEVDGQPLDVRSLYSSDSLNEDGACRDFIGLIRAWPPGKHTIQTTMRLDAQINDGWGDYQAGDYVDIYNITVMP
jgi:hypothetical protein